MAIGRTIYPRDDIAAIVAIISNLLRKIRITYFFAKIRKTKHVCPLKVVDGLYKV